VAESGFTVSDVMANLLATARIGLHRVQIAVVDDRRVQVHHLEALHGTNGLVCIDDVPNDTSGTEPRRSEPPIRHCHGIDDGHARLRQR